MMRVILAFGREKVEYKRFREQGEETVKARVDLTVRQTAFQLAVQLITAFGTAAVLGVGAWRAVNGDISAGQLVVVLTYVAQVYQPLESMTTTIAMYQQYFIAFRHALGLLDEEPQVTESPNAKPIGRARGVIDFESVSFRYEEREHVLRDVSFHIDAGESVAIIGPTGAGKSTLASLVDRFYDPDQGRVLIDGRDVRDVTLDSLRAQFSVVLQEPLLFSTSILENIRYGKPDAPREEIEAAAKAANAHDFIMKLPRKYNTPLGERGTKISGGERQRIAVARAFLRDAPILILDEPTSSIDSKTESVILDALERLMEGRTTLMIAHRLATIRSVDRIFVLDDGRLVQQGSHEELLSQPGLYRQLWEAQTGKRETDEAGSGGEHRIPEPLPLPPRIAGDEEVATSQDDQQVVPASSPPAFAPSLGDEIAPSVSLALPRPKIVLLGMLTKIPVGGVGWLVGHYAAGFERLGYEVYYVEAHARTPSMFMEHPEDDGARKAAAYIDAIARRFGFEGRWAFQALHEDDRCFGMTAGELDRLYREAALIVNMHGGTLPLPEHAATDRLVFLGTDPVEVELEVHREDRRAIEFLEHHSAFFTWGLNFGNPDCELPWAHPFRFVPSPPPVVMDFWDNDAVPDRVFTTIGNWRQHGRIVRHKGRAYRWSKHQQFRRFLNLPLRSAVPLELALASYDDADHLLLAEHGWRVRPGLELSRDLDSYRDYIIQSAGELSAAKEQNVHFRSGWFSERSVTYLAAGRPVVVQDTGFGAHLPTGEGLLAFTTEDEAAAALERIHADPARHRRAAREIAREHLAHDVVLTDMLEHVGLRGAAARPRSATVGCAQAGLPPDLSLKVRSRRPLELQTGTVRQVLERPVPAVRGSAQPPLASVVVPVLDNLACTRMALESVLANTTGWAYELIAVDNGSAVETRDYLEALAGRNRQVKLIRNEENVGFAAACNQGLTAGAGRFLVLLNNDTIVPPDWLRHLLMRLDDAEVGLVGPTTNRCGGAAQISTQYASYAEMVEFARERRDAWEGRPVVDLEVAEMFCVAMRRDILDAVGPLDERFEIGMFEDDDYSRRVRDAGYRVVCAEEIFVHHFGEASIGALATRGRYGRVFHTNRRRFEEKWGVSWEPHSRRDDADYAEATQLMHAAVRKEIPEGAAVLIVSRGDESLLELDGRDGWHFPQEEDGGYAGRHPDDDDEAIAQLERLRERGAEYLVLPPSALWYLEHYRRFRRHLGRYDRTYEDPQAGVIFRLEPVGAVAEAGGSG